MAAHRGCHVMSFASASLRTQLLDISGFTAKRINLSPFTKDFRAGEHFNESLNNQNHLQDDVTRTKESE